MTLIQLTEITHGDAHPWGVNPDHVATIRPRKTIIPIDAQQDPRGQIAYDGTIVELVGGDQHFVTEAFDVVADLMIAGTPDPPAVASTTPKKATPQKSGAKAEPREPVADDVLDMSALIPE